MKQSSKDLFVSILAIIYLGLGVIGIALTTKFPGSDNPPEVIIQSQSVLALSLLSVGLFYRSNVKTIEKFRGVRFLGILGLCCAVFSLAFICWIIFENFLNGKIFLTPICIALLAFGLFFGNKVMKQAQ